MSAGQSEAAATDQQLAKFASGLRVKVAIVDNKPVNCPSGDGGCFQSELTLSMPRELAPDFARGDFKIFFSAMAPVAEVQGEGLRSRWLNGDLHVLEPVAGARFEAGKSYRYRLWTRGHFFSAYYVMPNMFLVSGKLAPRVIAATRPVIDPESGLERLPFVAPMQDEARLSTASADDATRWLTPERAFETYAARAQPPARPEFVILPTPSLVRRQPGPAIDLRQGIRLRLSNISQDAVAPALAAFTRSDRGPNLSVNVAPGKLAPEAYRIDASGGRIRIEAADAAGASYALRSLAQQAAFEGASLRPILIEDAPRFPFRGLHLDLARNFHSKAEVLKLIEQMGVYRLNRLHLHLSDDEGWRLQIRGLPELTEIGGYRCYEPTESRCLLPQLGSGSERDSPLNGYLTQPDYLDILRAAKQRSIEVIPEFDMPGHSRAAIRSMEARYRTLLAAGRKAEAERFRLVEPEDRTVYKSVQNYSDNTLNVCLESTYRFVEAVIEDVARLHAEAGTPLKTYHFGADETAGAWTDSPACRRVMASTGRTPTQLGAMFVERISNMVASKGMIAGGWSDGLGHVDPKLMPAAVQSNIWGDLFTKAPAEAHQHANRGWKAVISVPNTLYFDVPYAPDPLERGLDWPTRGTDTFRMFSFMPENLAANASVMTDIQNHPTKVADGDPLQPGRSIAGIQAQLWSETVRSDALVDYMLFPRLIATAERAWHRADWEPAYRAGGSYAFGDGQVDAAKLQSDWAGFQARLPAQLAQLRRAGIFYRIAPPGARISGGMLEANSEFPGAEMIEYRVRRGGWRTFTQPVRVSGPLELRTRSADGRRVSRTVEVEQR
ncbi:MAG: family 20 glycosylhydrolase [Sphingomicrobium sp.]